jgi:tRNA (cytidine/uridine-2'-O-)-methyltransferase
VIEIALYQPDIAPNAATILRLCACLGLRAGIIEPAGFAWSDSGFRRAGMDYLDKTHVTRHNSWEAFLGTTGQRRILLVTTKGAIPYADFVYQADDIILMGRESSGVPPEVHARANARLRIPMLPGLRSLNVAMAAAMVAGEALRQTAGFPV